MRDKLAKYYKARTLKIASRYFKPRKGGALKSRVSFLEATLSLKTMDTS
jgi:hypothetical protein